MSTKGKRPKDTQQRAKAALRWLPTPVKERGKQLKATGQRFASGVVSSQLSALVMVNGTDKGRNGYVPFYEWHLRSIRHRELMILEIGVLNGASLRVWQAYFPKSTVLGIDINPKEIKGSRIHFRRGSQDDPVFLSEVADEFGPFDIVIDDGSHIGRHIIVSFDCLFPHVVPGGWYVIEDIGTAYWREYEGGPVGMEGTAVTMVKGLADSVFRRDVREGALPDAKISEMHLYPAIAFLRKAEHV
jgi:hypothetical protein